MYSFLELLIYELLRDLLAAAILFS